ncbi:uncharacterized protein M421DRAFT_10725 [Didymella exigua CBS 183.55]|uniref:Uncharacterized protein n=1 Tax=Didymella exigua CBS 183.55 TaxID=1150837 RepID=A0A6A5R2E7_9PLEO|nr:uncharacterized protein M421DRAFT_10725 [Didymella exigua CBS 183.55]KAF1922221.1 hypothetical protein M421DRAFT_10725 [Didymella exigua CBS 183.55]
MPGTGYNEMAQGWGFDHNRPWSMLDYPYSGYSYRYDARRNGGVRIRAAFEQGRSSTQRLTADTLVHAEVVGLAASIIQIGGSGAKLPKELYLFISTAARADHDITTIARDVDITSGVLANDAVKHARDLLGQCGEVFEEILAVVEKRRKVGKYGRKRLSLMGKMSWPMMELRVELLCRRLETLKSSLLVVFYVLQLPQSQAQWEVEKASLEEQRNNMRELHQQQQASLKILRVLEIKLSKFQLDDETTLQDTNPPSCT